MFKVQISEESNGVRVTGAKGKPATDTFKVSATYMDGYKATGVFVIIGGKAADKGRKTGQAILKRCSGIFQKMGLKDFDRTHLSILGAEDSFGK